jgi:uncharacterized membrane protein YczE
MDDKIVFRTLLISSISAGIGYLNYTKSGLTAGLITTFMAGWILFQFRSVKNTWENLGNFQNPILFGINCFFAAFIYSSWRQVPTGKALQLSAGVFLLGGALSLLIYKYWNIGS